MSNWVLGIDTSNYTTSVAAVTLDGELHAEQRRLLPVAIGERGLRQSEAVFSHVQQLPELVELLEKPAGELKAVAVSRSPRPVDGSYMPVFTVGVGLARALASASTIPLLTTSHQEGHIAAGLWSAKGPQDTTFLAVHLSGGTSELLLVRRGENADFAIERLGGSDDLHAGQFVDRVGVALGLPFPSGPHLERLAQSSQGELKLRSAVKGLWFSLSGAETQAQRLIAKGEAAAEIARAVENCIANSLEKTIRQAVESTGIRSILMVGGVAANSFIRSRLIKRLEHPAVGAKLYFAEPRACSDSAIGVGMIGVNKLKTSPQPAAHGPQ